MDEGELHQVATRTNLSERLVFPRTYPRLRSAGGAREGALPTKEDERRGVSGGLGTEAAVCWEEEEGHRGRALALVRSVGPNSKSARGEILPKFRREEPTYNPLFPSPSLADGRPRPTSEFAPPSDAAVSSCSPSFFHQMLCLSPNNP
jgi:hypothetical protein